MAKNPFNSFQKSVDSCSGGIAMSSKLVKTPYDELTYRIIGAAMAVHRQRGPGYREATYQRELEVRFSAEGLSFVAQKNFEVYDSEKGDVLVGYYIPDFVVEDTVVVEIKALSGLDNSHVAQVIAYLAVTGCPVGLLLNFGTRSLQKRRIFPPRDVTEHRINRQWLFVPDWLRAERGEIDRRVKEAD
ncbi:MAG TPA: GxxExxY protein [Anaerolineae bacterium]|nr:GxxExxY protein [Anaerolineae bacterium]